MTDQNTLRAAFAAGRLIFQEGEAGDRAFVIETGRVEITSHRPGGRILLATLGPGEIFGEMALIDDSVRSATATAVVDTQVVVIHREQIQHRIETGDRLVGLLLKLLLERFRATQQKILTLARLAETREPGSHGALVGRDFTVDYQWARDELRFGQELRQALASDDQLHVVAQPIVRMSDARLVGFEVLARWTHPERGPVPPAQFIALAEATGLIQDVDRWTFGAACRLLADMPCDADAWPYVAVNFSGRRFEDPGLRADVDRTLASTGVDPRRVCVELTESVLVADPERTGSVLEGLKALGIRIAVDDFGTGYSGLSYLHRLPIDTIKIDRSFIATMIPSQSSLKIVEALLNLARTLELRAVAEGVETTEQVSLLTSLGGELAQGYWFSRPLRPEDARALAARGRVEPAGQGH